MNQNFALSGILLGMTQINLPKELRDFLTSDGMDGIKDFELMLKDPKLSKRIPQDVRYQYEMLYASISIELDEKLSELEKSIKEIRSRPVQVVHEAIQSSLDCMKKQ